MSYTSSFAAQRPRTSLGLLTVVGLVSALIAPWLLIAAANVVPDRTVFAIFDDSVANWLNLNGTDATDIAFRIISAFGDWLLVTVVIAATVRFAMRRQLSKAVSLVTACGGAALINVLLAAMFRRAHPLSATSFESVAQGVNFPSGHSMVALVTYGMLTYFVLASTRSSFGKRAAAIAATFALVALIGFARVSLGIHSVSDVVLGFIAGAVWLTACIIAYPRVVAVVEAPSASLATLQPTPN
jgi:undecaprenyl-diphosphatase